MPRRALLKPSKRQSRLRDSLAPWVVNVPSELSEQGRREQLFFDTEKEAEKYWMDHKHPFFESDRPKGWGFSFVATYDLQEKKIVEYNTLWLSEDLANQFIKDALTEIANHSTEH